MENLIDKFLNWWTTNDKSIADDIFHKDIFYRDCASGNAIELVTSDVFESNNAGLKILKRFFCDNQAMLIFEQTDEITNLYYRFSVYLKSQDDKIIEVIQTKESVANENEL